MERWQDDAAAEFEDEFIVDQYMPRRKRRFVPKQSVEEEDVEVSEDLTRLGFRNDNGKWSRTAPRTGARTVVIEGSRGRTLEVKATTETDLHAISRLEYILTWSQLETPQNVWDAGCAARDPSFIFVWAAATARLGLLFSTQYGLDDFFSTEQLSLDASPEILVAGSIFVLAAYARKAHWSGSSGPLTVGALERSIADGWFTGFPGPRTRPRAARRTVCLTPWLLRY